MDREEMYNLLMEGSSVIGGAKKKPRKSAKKLSKWQKYVKVHMKPGVTMKQLARKYKSKKGGMVDFEEEDEEIRGGAERSISAGEWRIPRVIFYERAIKLGKAIHKDARKLYPLEYKAAFGSGVDVSDYKMFLKDPANEKFRGVTLREAWDTELKDKSDVYFSPAEKVYLDIGLEALKGAIKSAKTLSDALKQNVLFA